MPRCSTIIATNPAETYLVFDCPGCGTGHMIRVAGANPWTWNGDIERPTFTPSVLVNGDLSCPGAPRCHSFVTAGEIQFLADSTHTLAGKTVPLPEIHRDV